ncbi:MAG TPA: aspartate kinase, partial [Sphingobacteriaceae bacterium]
MEVFKFGGASVRDAESVENVAKIVSLNKHKELLIVVSAMGKTTNALEQLTEAYVNGSDDVHVIFEDVKQYHQTILNGLFQESHPIHDEVANAFVEIDWILEDEPHEDFDFNYDQIVSIGELVSSKILSAYLNTTDLQNEWLDARSFIQTDNTYREGQINWDKTCGLINESIPPMLKKRFIVTQGFIGGTSENFTTTLGREGSDYSAAVFASCLGADAVTIWKDVPGILNADPKRFNATRKYNELPYSEALEMAYYGATVIHPKTIKPLQNAGIPLLVRPFLTPEESGTIVTETSVVVDTPSVIVKPGQVLLSLSAKDFSFITEDHLSSIFRTFADLSIKINAIQISALSFSACFDWNSKRFTELSTILDHEFKLKY